MTEDFRDPFSDEELQRILGGGADEASTRVREFCAAIWRFFGAESNAQVGDARTVGFVVVAELQDSQGNRWLRHGNGTGEGRLLPSWTMRGYLGDALSYCDAVYDKLGSEIVERQDEE